MKKLSFILSFFITSFVFAQDAAIEDRTYGSGNSESMHTVEVITQPGGVGWAPQHMPGYPTAATLWPRVVEVECKISGKNLICDGYQVRPQYGRGEYLFIKPINKKKDTIIQAPACVTCNSAPPVIIYKEVPSKKIGG